MNMDAHKNGGFVSSIENALGMSREEVLRNRIAMQMKFFQHSGETETDTVDRIYNTAMEYAALSHPTTTVLWRSYKDKPKKFGTYLCRAEQPITGIRGCEYLEFTEEGFMVEHFDYCKLEWLDESAAQPSTVLGWVDVKDRLPEVGEDVLVYLTAVVLKGVLYHGGWMVFYSDGLFESKDVTHWMPLPPAPNTVIKPFDFDKLDKDIKTMFPMESNSTPTPTNEIEKSFSLEQVKELLSQQRSMCADALWNNRFGFMGTMSEDQCKKMMIYIENYDAPTIKADNFSNSLTEDQLKKYNEGIEDLKKKIMEIKNK